MRICPQVSTPPPSPMPTLEDVLIHFAKHASEENLEQLEARRSFKGGLHVLKAYARENMGMGTESFKSAESRSRRHYTGRLETMEDLWLLMVYRKDLKTHGPQSSESSSDTSLSYPEPPPPAFRPHKKKGFGLITPGTGDLITFPYRTKRVAYFRDKSSGRNYKAKVHNGKVKFVRFSFLKGFLSSIKEIGVAGFTVSWDLNFSDISNNNLLFSKIFKGRDKAMVDWAMALIDSGDILISEDSKCGGYAPAKLVSDTNSMKLSKPLRKTYLEGKKFLFDPRSKDLYWVPSEDPYMMKVKVGNLHNTFERVHEHRIKHFSRLKQSLVWQLEKHFV